MCQPFHERNGDWWRYSNTWVLARKASACVENVENFITEKQRAGSKLGIDVSFFSETFIAGEEHLLACAMHALRAKENETMKTRAIGLEVLLYAAGAPHVNKAIQEAGIKNKDEALWTLVSILEDIPRPKIKTIEDALQIIFVKTPWSTNNTPSALERAALLDL